MTDSPSSAPEVTVVIPTRNRRARLRLALVTALSQRDVDLEVVIVDDGSTDGTAERVSRVGDPRVRLLQHEDPRGESAARNTGVSEARGKWVAFLDDDDLWAPDKLARQLNALKASGRTWVYAGDVIVDDDLQILDVPSPPSPEGLAALLPRYNAVPAGASNVMVRADVLVEAGPFDVGLYRTADWDMWLRLARLGSPAWVPEPLVVNRMHVGSASSSATGLFEELRLMERRHGIRVDWPRHHRWAAWNALRRGRRGEASRHYLRAALSGDVRSLLRAVGAWTVRADGKVKRRENVSAPSANPGLGTWLRALADTREDVWASV